MTEPEVDASPVGSRNEATRRRNLSAVLRYVHHHGDTSRADLTRLTGLNRSTVGVLAAELVELGLATELEPEHLPSRSGRPSPLLHASSDVVALGINPEIDAVHLGVIGLGGVVHEVLRAPVSAPPSMQTVVRLVKELMASSEALRGRRLVGAGLAVPGMVDEHGQIVAVSHHLGWRDVPASAALEDALDVPVVSANDANVGAVAEALFGAGRGHQDLVYLNGSVSGIGAGVIMEGRLLRGARSFAGELGHLTVQPGGARCGCGRHGCLEAHVAMSRFRRISGVPDLDFDALDELLRDPPLAVRRELERQTEKLAQGVATIITILAPRRVVLGGLPGSILDAVGDPFVARVRDLAMPEVVEGVAIVRNDLRARMMPVGAAELAFAGLLQDPSRGLLARETPARLSDGAVAKAG